MKKKLKNKRPILVTGGSGLIGSYFLKSCTDKLNDIVIISPAHQQMDITDKDSIKRYFELYEPLAVIHLAAFRDATNAEKQRGNKEGSVWKVNVEGSKNISLICKYYESYLVHISTDYVFSGHRKNPGPYSEKDEPKDHEGLLSWYGITKREGEKRVLESSSKVSVVRIGNITRSGNDPELDYIGKILWLYDQKKIYPMFDDQRLTLTYVPGLVDIIVKLLKVRLPGIFHVSTNNLVTPHELANYLIERVYGNKNAIKGVSIDSYLKLNPRRYPKYGGLKSNSTQKKLNINALSWQEVVDIYAAQMRRKKFSKLLVDSK